MEVTENQKREVMEFLRRVGVWDDVAGAKELCRQRLVSRSVPSKRANAQLWDGLWGRYRLLSSPPFFFGRFDDEDAMEMLRVQAKWLLCGDVDGVLDYCEALVDRSVSQESGLDADEILSRAMEVRDDIHELRNSIKDHQPLFAAIEQECGQ